MADGIRGSLRAAAAGAPHLPGVYSFVDGKGEILYIGKAGDLFRRLSGHLSSEGDARHRTLVRRAASVEWTVTRSEREALILEAELIRLYKPPLNVRLRSGNRYPYIEVTTDEEYPRLVITRRLDPARTVPRFGPYPDARSLRRLMAFLLEAWPLRRCGGEKPPSRESPCLMGQMKRCPAVCCGGITREEYGARVEAVVGVLRGDWEHARNRMRRRMERLSAERRYEEAARWRDLLDRLEDYGWPSVAGSGMRSSSTDAIAIRENWALVMQVRSGRATGSVRLPFNRRWKGAEPSELMSIFLRSYYARTMEIPGEILVSVEPADRELLVDWLRERRGRSLSLARPGRGERRELIELACTELEHFLERLSWESRGAESAKRLSRALEELRELLDLEAPPAWILGLDASNLGGSYPVAAIVSFRGGLPDKSGYRRFAMSPDLGRDDPAMICEAVRRYYESYPDAGEGERPDLLLVDGGITQLRAAAFGASGWPDPPLLVAIAKSEESLLIGSEERKALLPDDSPGLLLLRRIRDEAHRFVIHYHRLSRSRGELRSRLDDVPGIGPRLRGLLLSSFGSVERIAAATASELASVPGVGRKRAEAIRRWLSGGTGGDR